jgi:hypothetical protein
MERFYPKSSSNMPEIIEKSPWDEKKGDVLKFLYIYFHFQFFTISFEYDTCLHCRLQIRNCIKKIRPAWCISEDNCYLFQLGTTYYYL